MSPPADVRHRTDSSQVKRTVNASFKKALEMMEKAGYGIGDNVSVVVDPDLPFMGYTFPSGGRYTIVASGTAVDSGMLEGLLVHEMSHIYRMKSNHPSHDAEIINEAIGRIARRGFDRDHQLKILHDMVNHLEDLYADDVAFRLWKVEDFPGGGCGPVLFELADAGPCGVGECYS